MNQGEHCEAARLDCGIQVRPQHARSLAAGQLPHLFLMVERNRRADTPM